MRLFTKRCLVIAFFSLFISIHINAKYVSDYSVAYQNRISDLELVGENSFYRNQISIAEPINAISISGDTFKISSNRILGCVLLLSIYILMVRKKTNSRNADF